MSKPNRGPFVSTKPNKYGIYDIQWSEHGRSRRLSTGRRTFAEAQQVCASFLLGFHQRQGRLDQPTVAVVLAEYWDGHVTAKDHQGRPRVVARGTAAYAIANLAAHFAKYPRDTFKLKTAQDFFDALRLHIHSPLAADISTADVRAYVEARKVGDGAVRRELSVLVAALGHAARTKVMKRHDMPEIEMPPEPEPRDRWLTDDETVRLLDAAAGGARMSPDARLSRCYRFVTIARLTGARKRAIEELTWFQVDFDKRVINLNPEGRQQQRTKRRPTVPIADALMPILRRARKEAISIYVLDHKGSIRKTFETAVVNAKLEGVHPHVLRHTWATRAAQSGVPMWEIAQVLGDTVQTVTKRYLKHCPEHLRHAVNAGVYGSPDLRVKAHMGTENVLSWPNTSDKVL